MTPSSLYDEYYYSHDCGRPYQRDEGWLNFFDQIAKRIIEQFEPITVLDAGCAWGFLVEAFRKRDVEAFGVDISEYAIQKIHPDIRPYCWIGSITEPFPKKYDLITCIEVLEHMPRREAETAIENLCIHANEIIFSSTPFDYKEATHVNVHDPEYWAEQFARYDFYRDMDADMSCITSWAVRFIKTKRTNIKLVEEYERKSWQLRKENFDLRQSSLETQDRLRQQEDQIQTYSAQVAEKEQAIRTLSSQFELKEDAILALLAQVDEKERLEQILREKMAALDAEASIVKNQLQDIHQSRSWRILRQLQRLRLRLVPPESLKKQVLIGKRKK
jgi:SAM-dependent methyltransferase